MELRNGHLRVPLLPDPADNNAHTWIALLPPGWNQVPYWGAEEWPLFRYPDFVLAEYGNHLVSRYALATYHRRNGSEVGRVQVLAFDNPAERDRAIADIAVAFWREYRKGPIGVALGETARDRHRVRPHAQ